MLNTYIKNKGVTQTIIRNNNQNQFNEVNWDADYDGNTANISVTTDDDGIKQQYDITLDSIDLENLFNINSVDIPLHKRLMKDFSKTKLKRDPSMYYIELPDTENTDTINSIRKPYEQSDTLQSLKPHSYLSSPITNEEFIVPITINDKHHIRNKYTLTPKKHHRRKKTHNTYKVYKKQKSSTKTINKPWYSSKSKSQKHKRTSVF
jgi:hypothetical protein